MESSYADPSRIGDWDTTPKLEAAIRRSLPLLPGDVQAQVAALLAPEALAIMAGVLVLWAGSHFIGIGEVADVILLTVGVLALGAVAFEAAGELVSFAKFSIDADSEADLDAAARHFARAISLVGVQTVMALLLRGRPRAFRRPNVKVPPPPPPRGRFRYRPTLRRDPKLPAGTGFTTEYGDIVISSQGSARTQRLTELHERVHQLLTPKLYLLRSIRVRMNMNAYTKSYILRYIEEALAETVAQVGVNGVRGAITGIRFPIGNAQYEITVARMGTEAAGILLGPINVAGMTWNAYLSASSP